MEENIKKNTLESEQEPAGKSLFNFQTIYMTLILNWKRTTPGEEIACNTPQTWVWYPTQRVLTTKWRF